MTTNKSSAVLATDLAVWPVLQGQERITEIMYASAAHWSALANYLLLYDTLVIPTGNYQILPILRLMLGESVFDELVNDGTIRFLRFDVWFAYSNTGLCFFSVHKGPEHCDNLATSFYLPQDQAVDLALRYTNPPSDASRRKVLTDILYRGTQSVNLTSLTKDLGAEVQKDFHKSRYLLDSMSPQNRNRPINALRGVAPNKLIVFSPHALRADAPRDAWTVLSVAFENMVLALGGAASATDIVGEEGTLDVVRAKGRRFRATAQQLEAFAGIQELEQLPNLGRAFHSKDLTPDRILALRRSKEGEELRRWFCENKPGDMAADVMQRFVKSIGRPSWIDKLPTRVLRFATSTAWGFVEPVSGLVASAVDSFLLSNWFPARSPRLFMDRAKAVLDVK